MSKTGNDLGKPDIRILQPGECVRIYLVAEDHAAPDGERVLSWLGVVDRVDLLGIRFIAVACITDTRKVSIRDETPHVAPWIRIADVAVIEPGALGQEIAKRRAQRAAAA